jgi:hypothetical protein
MARPSKRSKERDERLAFALAGGNTRRASCIYAGISESTLADWIERYPDFRELVEKAEADAEMRMVSIIQSTAQTTWTAAAWWLERKRKVDWAQRTETTGDSGGAVRVIVEYAQDAPELNA